MQSDRMVISLRPGGGAGNCRHGSTPHPLAATPQSAPSPFSPSFAPPAPPSLLRLENQGLGVMNMSITQGINYCILTEKERVLKTVKGILNKLTPEKFDVLKGQLINAGITTPNILKDVITLIFEKAVFRPTFSPMFSQLCSDLNENLPLFPSEDGSKLLKQKMVPEKIVHHITQGLLGHDNRACPAEENDEAICQLFNTIGKQLDESPNSHCFNDAYFNWLKESTINPQLAPHLRFMVCVVLGLRKNNWIPRREEVKTKTISKIHIEAEKNLGLHPGATASMRNSRDIGGLRGLSVINRPGLVV